MTYPQAISYLGSLINYERFSGWAYRESFRLERFRDFLHSIGDPQAGLKCVHVAGSKGKGSTCAFISYVLRRLGYNVGLYTSPHLSDFRERIRILGVRCQVSGVRQGGDFEGMIPRKDLARLVTGLKPAIDKFHRAKKHEPLSFFEVYTALAFIYFKEKKVDFAVLETGLGGRLDATNTVDPLVCVITPISYEHTQQLGNTLKAIAGEKAGIIKSKRSIVISAEQKEEVARVIRERCKHTGARLYRVGKDTKYKENRNGSFTVRGIKAGYSGLRIRLLGPHQMANASAAIAAVEALGFYGSKAAGSIRQGLYETVWPGRCEVILRRPTIVLDGAQNSASAGVLKKAIRENFSAAGGSASGGKYKKLILVLGISSDKDIKGICRQFRGFVDRVILTKADNPRAIDPEKLAGNFCGKEIFITKNVKEAGRLALMLAGQEDLIVVTGSLFVVGEFRDER
ncbi:MAG: folylpolyglutamate synthase/dihydrofolate synthase family protein [Candidatus Omnitrophota bacterium]